MSGKNPALPRDYNFEMEREQDARAAEAGYVPRPATDAELAAAGEPPRSVTASDHETVAPPRRLSERRRAGVPTASTSSSAAVPRPGRARSRAFGRQMRAEDPMRGRRIVERAGVSLPTSTCPRCGEPFTGTTNGLAKARRKSHQLELGHG